MAAIDALKTAWETEIAKISDPLVNADATYKLDGYIAALTQQTALEAKDISSYSIGGRTFTYRTVSEGASMVRGLESILHDEVYGRANLVDFNVRTTENQTS
jgi:hypothetical protein